jgi:hypothetical protein
MVYNLDIKDDLFYLEENINNDFKYIIIVVVKY